jgi:UDP-glucose 4-epimerase
VHARRSGDVAVSLANADKAFLSLGWKTSLSVEDAIRDGWNFIQKNNS